MVNPILKWIGGKRWLLKYIITLFPKYYRNRTFHEPMFGAGAVTFYLAPNKGTINDISPRLARFYEVVRNEPEKLIAENIKLEYENNERDFYRARNEFNAPVFGKKLDMIREASLLIYLNRTCYRALYRENAKGEFNAAFGNLLKPDLIRRKQIRECSEILKNMEILNEDYSYILNKAKSGDLVYFDPPFSRVIEIEKGGFYTNEDFSFEDQKYLRDICIKLDKNGIFFVLSNSWIESVRVLFQEIEEFQINQVFIKTQVSRHPKGSRPVPEMLVTNVPAEQRNQTKLTMFGNEGN